jgi:hypothetical protein
MISAMTTELIASIANTVGAVVVVAALATLVVGLLERSHRRASGLGRAPHGADLGASPDRDRVRDMDTLRVEDELRAARGRAAGPTQTRPILTPPSRPRRGPVRNTLRSV